MQAAQCTSASAHMVLVVHALLTTIVADEDTRMFT